MPALALLWLLLSVAAEFSFSHFAGGAFRRNPLADYHLFGGRLWLVVLAAMYFAPILLGRPVQPARLAPRGEEPRGRQVYYR